MRTSARNRSAAIAALLASATFAPVPATAQYLGGGTKTAHGARVADLEDMHQKFVSLGRAFPDEARDWRPMEGVRSVRDVLVLIAAEGALFGTLWDVEAPAWVPDPRFGPEMARLGELSFDSLLADVDRNFGYAIEQIRAMDDEVQARRVDFFGLEVPAGAAVTLMANDMHEHLGQLIAYARTNRVVPPWSQPGG